ncbi:zinc finger protein 710-like isoform X2 [Zootermopsis nevadensis]|uniref:zinc finger protein 710-like isoform X2 n=1 Tax=Zootermopsis nevadensis TaxID=136037 RepID=UPI000B8E91B2|nr:zinc finger protein 710-like isoform X2 [Zootermopsis nevadensis]
MNIPITTVGSQVYVQFPSAASSQFQNILPTNQEDLHICGACKQNFSDISLFVEHKHAGCIRNTQKPPGTASALLGQSTMGYVSTTSSSGGEDSTSPSPIGPPIFRVIVDGSNLSMQPGTGNSRHTLSCRENGDSQILRSRLLGIQNDQQLAVNQQNIAGNSGGMQAIVMQQHSRREFQIDEEAVATILANQLANEDVTSTHVNMSPSRTGNMGSEMIVRESRESLDLGSLGLPGDAVVTLELESEPKRCCSNKDIGHTESSQPTRKIVSGELKDKLWAQASEKDLPEDQLHLTTSSVPCSLSAGTADISPPIVGFSSMSRSRTKKRHDCTFDGCGFSTCYLKDLVRHMRRHTGERPFQCETCQRSFSRGDKLQMHLRIHSGVKPHHCDQCGYATIDRGSLRKHMRIHNDERPYKCQICPYRSRDSSQLTVHLRTHTGDNPFVCPYESCSSAFKTSSDLKRHARMHTGEKPFTCEFCDYKCAIKSNLQVHLRLNHTEVKSIPCSSCNHVSTSKRAAKEHDKIHADEVLKCGICAYTCISTASMKSHLRIHTQDKRFSCKHCQYTCRQQGNLKTHMKKKHLDLRVSKRGKGATKDSVAGKVGSSTCNLPKSLIHCKPFCYKSYRCTCCDAAFVREDSWRSHMRQHQAQESVLSSTVSAAESSLVSDLESCEQQRAVTLLGTDSLRAAADLLDQEQFMLSLDNQNTGSKEVMKIDQQFQKSKDISLPESGSRSRELKEGCDKRGQLVSADEQDATQPMLLYVQNSSLPEGNVDDSLRNAEILASLNQAAPILVTGRCGQYITLPTDQNLVEQLAASLHPGTAYQYVLSNPLGNDGAFIQTASGSDSELASHIDSAVHIPSIISLHMDKQSVVEDKN